MVTSFVADPTVLLLDELRLSVPEFTVVAPV